ncbi:Ubiquitin-related domain,Ubiquitin domain [Cinara cedri]|uniref:Ubiquitin-related domain,Ubiquitin domain n=1 Tax=Cinara cedri TaxID=506608 RepID=A0A5E4MAA4_9HEMI|nr:Ubiquitin-related domain,Ubiquitin domain [Cinara cedri]
MDIGFQDPWITLTIKAPNQQIDDQTVKCKLDWSVAKLKGYIRETYPNKPKTEDQRLIYSGQLLTDSIILKDILRPYDEDGQLNRIVHLVCASSSSCIPPTILEKRKSECPKINDGASTSGTNVRSAVNQEACKSSNNKQDKKKTRSGTKSSSNNNPSNSNAKGTPLTPEQIALEQIHWVNKMYAIQMAEYWKTVVSSLEDTLPSNTQNINNEPPRDLTNNENNNQQAEQNVAPDNNANRNVREFGQHHDWLDWLYVTSRLLIFISVLYFYSSPGRFIIVACFALLLYLYQTGYFRQFHERRRLQPPESQDRNGNVNDPTAVRQNEPLFSFLWTVIITFFTSLIPQQPDVI